MHRVLNPRPNAAVYIVMQGLSRGCIKVGCREYMGLRQTWALPPDSIDSICTNHHSSEIKLNNLLVVSRE